MSPDSTPAPSASPQTAPPGADQLRVVLLYRRHAPPEEALLCLLETELTRRGFAVFVDRQLTPAVEWAREIERQIRTADAVVPLLSADSVLSEMLGFEIEIAHEAAQVQHGRPRLLPIRLGYGGALPEPLAGILDPIRHIVWTEPNDGVRVLNELVEALGQLPRGFPTVPSAPVKGARLIPKPVPVLRPPGTSPNFQTALLEAVGGAVPIDSPFYVVRPPDVELRNAISRRDSVILIKGARQMGKTSLLARGLKHARDLKARVALTDFQKFNAANLETVANLHLSLAESLADQLDLACVPADVWDDRRGPNVNLERFLRKEVLGRIDGPVVWGLDEVDRLFAYPYGSEVFGLFRSWHNERALDPTGPWSRLTLAIAYATEAHLFITDLNQSPFNIGTRLALEDFYPEQVAELNERYGSPLKTRAELDRMTRLVGGQPYLVRRGLHEMVKRKMTLAAFEEKAPHDEGIYGDHLRRILVLLAKDPVLMEVVRAILQGRPCPSAESFYRLRSAGIMAGTSQTDVRPRCELYARYLSRYLLEPAAPAQG